VCGVVGGGGVGGVWGVGVVESAHEHDRLESCSADCKFYVAIKRTKYLIIPYQPPNSIHFGSRLAML